VRNALARFSRVTFEDDRAEERARRRLLNAAMRYGIDPVGFMTGQLRWVKGRSTGSRTSQPAWSPSCSPISRTPLPFSNSWAIVTRECEITSRPSFAAR
jgi:hypothetical protein